MFKTRGNIFWQMTHKDRDKKVAAFKALLGEYEKLRSIKLCALSKVKDHTFENTVPLLAKFYKVIFETFC